MIIDNHLCATEIQKVVYSTWQADRRWQKLLTPTISQTAFKAPTTNSNKWVHIIADSSNLRAVLSDEKSALIIDWGKNCNKTISHQLNNKKPTRLKNSLTDKDITEMVTKNETGIIYIWAPEMPYSIDGIDEIKKSATIMNTNLTVLLSPVSDFELAKKIIKKRKLNSDYLIRHDSNQLHLRGVDLHYPSLVTYRDKKLNRYARHGYEPEQYFTAYLKEEFSK